MRIENRKQAWSFSAFVLVQTSCLACIAGQFDLHGAVALLAAGSIAIMKAMFIAHDFQRAGHADQVAFGFRGRLPTTCALAVVDAALIAGTGWLIEGLMAIPTTTWTLPAGMLLILAVTFGSSFLIRRVLRVPDQPEDPADLPPRT